MNLIKGSLQDELDYFFRIIGNVDIWIRAVTKGAFTRARKKVGYTAFIELNNAALDYFYQKAPVKTWHGFRLLAIDGSTGLLEKIDEIIEHFDLFTTSGNGVPLARISQMFDVLNKITVQALIGPMEDGEREYAFDHNLSLNRDDLLLLDRGYPAFWLFKLIYSVGGNFCARTTTTLFKEVDKFVKSGKIQKIVELKASYPSKKKCAELGLDSDPISVRLIRVELDSGEVEVLMTSLFDSEKYAIDIFADLYHNRWPVETDYNMMKNRLAVEGWSGKSVLSVYQDFHAKVLSKNLTAILVHQAQEELDSQTSTRKYYYQINFTQALSKLKDTIVLLFQKNDISEMIRSLVKLFKATTEPIRDGRKNPRNKKVKPRKFRMNYKPCR